MAAQTLIAEFISQTATIFTEGNHGLLGRVAYMLVRSPMTGLAVELRDRHMDAMREKHMRRQAPHPLPGNFLSLLPKRLEFFYLRVFRVAARMTSQTKGGGRSPRHEIFLGALMATGAGNVLFDMSLVRKLDGLLDPRHAPIGPVTKGQRN